MLVPHTPPPSLHSHRLLTGFFSLPPELREEVYTYCLDNITPATYIIYRHASAGNWSFRRPHHAGTPAVLLVCKAMHHDVQGFLNRGTAGPRVMIGPSRYLSEYLPCGDWLYDKADETDCVFALTPLLSAAGKLDVGFNVSSNLAEQGRVLALLRWMVAVVNAREEAPRSTRVALTLERASLRPCERGSLWKVLDALRCQNLEVVCLWRSCEGQWVKQRLDSLSGVQTSETDGSEAAIEQKEMDVAIARQGVLDSCKRRYGRAPRDQPTQGHLGRWPSVSKFW